MSKRDPMDKAVFWMKLAVIFACIAAASQIVALILRLNR